MPAFVDENVRSWWITDQLFVYFGEHHKGAKYRKTLGLKKVIAQAYLNAGQEVLTSIKMPFIVCYAYLLDGTRESVTHDMEITV